jgi:hypothetical protein
MESGYVALLDVLGFSSLVSGDGVFGRLQEYQQYLQEALMEHGGDPKVESVVFSDSIVLTTTNDSEDSLQALILRCSRVFGLMLQREIPLRGAIAHGSFLRSTGPTGVFVAGKAIIDAYKYETAQDWVGIMLAPSAIKRIRNLAKRCEIPSDKSKENLMALRERLSWAAFVQDTGFGIPFHNVDRRYHGFAVVPSDGNAEVSAIVNSLNRSLEVLEWLMAVAPDTSAQAKCQAAHIWLSVVRLNWQKVEAEWKKLDRSPPSQE